MKSNASSQGSKVDRAATFDEVRIATLLQSDPGFVPVGPDEYYCDVISESGEHSKMLWFDLEYFSESNSKSDLALN